MRFQALALGAFVGFGVCAPNVASAQAMPAVEPIRDWSVGLRADGSYDNNVSRSNEDFATTKGLRRDDYTFTPAATFSFVQPFGRQAVFINGDTGYTFHRYNKELNRQRAKVQGGVAAVLGPCRQSTFLGYDAAQSDQANLDIATTKNLRQTTNIGVGLQCARSIGPGVQIMVQRTDSKNSAEDLEESDSTTETALLGVTYGRPSLGIFNIGFNYASTEYPNRIIPGRPVGDGFFSQSYSLGYSREFGSRLKVSASGGISHVKREVAAPGADQSFNSANYAADVIYGFGERIDLELHAQRGITPSQQVGKALDKRTSADVVVRYKAGRRLSFSASYGYQDVDSNVDTASQLLVVTSSQLHSFGGSVNFKPNEIMSLSLDVRHDKREANLPQFTYNATRVGVKAQASF